MRHDFTTRDIIHDIWASLNLPPEALASLDLPDADAGPALPSSFKIGPLAQGSIALSALAARLVRSTRAPEPILPPVRVPVAHAVVEFKSNDLYTLQRNSRPLPPYTYNPLGGLHRTSDGHVRIHDVFPNHVRGTLALLGLSESATRADVARQVARWEKLPLEERGYLDNVAIYAVRSYEEWDSLPQADALSLPILLRRCQDSTPRLMAPVSMGKCLSGLRVVEMTRVIAGPVSGKTLAAHGADVIWVTSPGLPTLPSLDVDLSRGKRHIQLDIHNAGDKKRLLELLGTCDVFIQGYRPGSLAAYGLSRGELERTNPGIICANMSAFGPAGPWSGRRGFDSLVQAASGMNVSEARHARDDEPRALPCQALDHASGYLLAVGVMAAVYHRSLRGGSWEVDVSLAATMKYLRGLGQYPCASGFDAPDYTAGNVPRDMLVTTETAWGTLTAVRHSAEIQGCDVGWDLMPCLPDKDITWLS
jgi:crotonobetainyl-CoA:carnitine CoA-transferase CaiB-like acyl-CoA transferase